MNAVVISDPPAEATSILAVIERACRSPDVDVDKMERLFALQERFVAKQAETAFNVALNSAQSNVGRIATDAANPQTRSRYASYAALDRVLRPAYIAQGFSLSFDTTDSPVADHIRVLCHVSHSAGHTRTYHVDMPADGKGAKGGDVMTKTHATGAAMSYGMRYLLKMIFNVAIGEDDNDGNGSHEYIGPGQVADLEALLTEVGGDRARFLKYMKADSIQTIPLGQYQNAVAALQRKRQA
jgi:hypothetical protein